MRRRGRAVISSSFGAFVRAKCQGRMDGRRGFESGIYRVMRLICRCSQLSYPLCNSNSFGSFPDIQLPRHVISCISRCNLVLSFSALEQSPSRCPTNLQGYEGLSSEARNGIQRLRGFLGRWFSQIYDKLSESAEAELSL